MKRKKTSIKHQKSFRKIHSPDQSFKNQGKNKKLNRKFVEQQATKTLIKKDDKPSGKSKLKLKTPIDKRDFKLTVSRALNVEEIEIKQRSLASVKKARLKEKKSSSETEEKKEYKKVIKEVKIPEQITIQELSNRMAEKSNDIIKFLFNMKVMATINHNIDKDTAEYIKEFGHTPIIENSQPDEINKNKSMSGKIEKDHQLSL